MRHTEKEHRLRRAAAVRILIRDRGFTVPQIAKETGWSNRTIERDLDEIKWPTSDDPQLPTLIESMRKKTTEGLLDIAREGAATQPTDSWTLPPDAFK